MSNKHYILAAVMFSMLCANGYAQEDQGLLTLFTTPQERQIINANRYKSEKKQAQQPQQNTETVAVRELIKEKVVQNYQISGISINSDGSKTAWINNQAYENGAILESGSKLRINNTAIKSVTITTPDGKQHTATSGDTLAVTYLRALEQ